MARIKHIMEKIGATDCTGAVAIGVRRGIIQIQATSFEAGCTPPAIPRTWYLYTNLPR